MSILESFKNYLFSQKNSASLLTVKNYLADVRKFILWIERKYQASFDPKIINAELLNEYREYLSKKFLSSSVERQFSALRKFIHYLTTTGQLVENPFEHIEQVAQASQDLWYLKSFRAYLSNYNNSKLTIKNYIIDIKQFLLWSQDIFGITVGDHKKELNKLITLELIEDYKQKLLTEKIYSTSSVNRKLSSLRKYFLWLNHENLINNNISRDNITQTNSNIGSSLRKEFNIEAILGNSSESIVAEKLEDKEQLVGVQTYSKFPPIRLLQKTVKIISYILDKFIITPIVQVTILSLFYSKLAKKRPVFSKTTNILANNHTNSTFYSYSPSLLTESSNEKLRFKISNYFFNIGLSISYKIKRYQNKLIFKYFNFIALTILCTITIVSLYITFFRNSTGSLATNLAAPPRVLSFQGRLTDSSNNPITAATDLRFSIYNDPSASSAPGEGSLIWQEADYNVVPDSNGIFTVLLGRNETIPQSIFFQNTSLYLGVSIANTKELKPRQQLATVSYAKNTEELQGMTTITDPSVLNNQNVILALNSNGVLSIPGNSNTTFQSPNGEFTLTGKTLTLSTAPGTDTNIQLAPDGIGVIDIQKPITNSTLNSNIRSADGSYTSAGAVEIDKMLGILATSSGQSAFTIDQEGLGPVISASHSGVGIFTVDTTGNVSATGNITGNTLFTGNGSSYYISASTSNLNGLTLSGNLNLLGNITSNITPSASGVYNLGSPTQYFGTLYAQNIITNAISGQNGFWEINQGVISPSNSSNDFTIGGNATGSAFQVFANATDNGPAGTASTTGNLVFAGNSPTIQSISNNSLTIGGTTTGNIILSPGNGSGSVALTGSSSFMTGTGLTTIGGNLVINGVSNGPSTLIHNPNTNSNTMYEILQLTTNNQGVGAGGYIQFKDLTNTDIAKIGFSDSSNSGGSLVFYTKPANGNALSHSIEQARIDPNGNLGLGTISPLATLDIRGNSNTSPIASLSGTTNFAGLVVDQSGSGDIIAASQSGLARFTVSNNGTIQDSKYTIPGGIVYSTSTGLLQQTTSGNIGDCLKSNGTGVPSWGPCGNSAWQLNGNLISPTNSNYDLTIGGSATGSAFQVFANASKNQPAGTVSTSGNLIFSSSSPTIQTTSDNMLTIGGNTTGDINLIPSHGNGSIILGSGESGTPSAITLRGANAAGSNILGANTIFAASNGTGMAGSGELIFETAPGGPALDNTSVSTSNSNATTLTWNHLVGSENNMILVVGVAINSNSISTATLTLDNSTNFTNIGSITASGTRSELWYIKNPGSGNHTIALKLTGAAHITAGGASYYNVNLQNPIGILSSQSGTSSNALITNTPTNTNQVIIDMVSTPNIGGNPSLNQVTLFNSSSYTEGGMSATIGSQGNTPTSWSFITATPWAYTAVPINGISSGTSDALAQRMTIDQKGNVGIGTISAARTLDVNGTWGGNTEIRVDTIGSDQTIQDNVKAVAYDFENNQGSVDKDARITYNILGLPSTDGTFAFIHLVAEKDTTLANHQDCIDVEVQSQLVESATTNSGCTLNTTASSSAVKDFMLIRTNGNWHTASGESTNNLADLAEYFDTTGKLPQAGELVSSVDNTHVSETQSAYDSKVMGIVSTNPNTTYGAYSTSSIPLALTGRIPAIVTSVNGNISNGDFIVSSPFPGIGMKPSKESYSVGKALESFTPTAQTCTTITSLNNIPWPADDGLNVSKPCFQLKVSSLDLAMQMILAIDYNLQPTDTIYIGKIMALANLSNYNPQIELTSTNNFTLISQNASNISNYIIKDFSGKLVQQVAVLSNALIGNLKAGAIISEELTTNKLTIAGQSLKDYILAVVNQAGLGSNGTQVISPTLQTGEVHTNIISPLGSTSIGIKLDKNKISITNNASNSAVAVIDNQGNASFSGKLNSNNLAVNSDATISGTLYAHRIKADQIDGLAQNLSTISAQNITNITNIYYATPTPTVQQTSSESGAISLSNITNSLPDSHENYEKLSSYSAFLSYVPKLEALTAQFDQGLMSFGPTSLSDTSITGQLAIGGQMILNDNGINVLGTELALQPLRQGGLSLEGGQIKIDTDGNISVNGKAIFYNTLATNILSPIGGNDLTIKLGSDTNVTSQSSFKVENASSSAIFGINQLGDIFASGAANINKLNFNVVAPALAVSENEVIATSSAGTSNISPNQQQVTIDDSLVTQNSLIYITPVGTVSAIDAPYLLRQVPQKSFSVGISQPVDVPIQFNWLIVN